MGEEEQSRDQIGEQMAAIFGNGEFQTMLEDAEAADQAVKWTADHRPAWRAATSTTKSRNRLSAGTGRQA